MRSWLPSGRSSTSFALLLGGLVAACVLSFAPATAQAADTWVDGRFYISTPVATQATRAEIGSSFRDVLPFGSRVELHYGFGIQPLSTPSPINDWQFRGIVQATPIAPYTWSAWVDHALHEQGRSKRSSRFQFVWRVILPDGSYYFERGSSSRLGFFETKLPEPGSVQAVDRDDARFQSLRVYVVTRD